MSAMAVADNSPPQDSIPTEPQVIDRVWQLRKKSSDMIRVERVRHNHDIRDLIIDGLEFFSTDTELARWLTIPRSRLTYWVRALGIIDESQGARDRRYTGPAGAQKREQLGVTAPSDRA